MKVLIVDDVVINQRLISAAIRDLCDAGILFAERATKAIELALTSNPDLIFMDIGLPDINGLDAVDLIKKNPLISHIPVVVVSAHAQSEFIERAKQVGCDGYITKPATIEGLRQTVQHYRNVIETQAPATSEFCLYQQLV